jgi:hypothetical protein
VLAVAWGNALVMTVSTITDLQNFDYVAKWTLFLATTLLFRCSAGAHSAPVLKQIFDRSQRDVNRLFVFGWDKRERAA